MNPLRNRFACEAEALLGCPFRLHGRNPRTGLDCVGVALVALARCDVHASAPADYALRNLSIAEALARSTLPFRSIEDSVIERGDVLIAKPSPAQHHVLVATGPASFVHAHAGLRRVVRQSGLPLRTILHHWRLD